MSNTHPKPTASKARMDNRLGISVGRAFRNSNHISRFNTYARPSVAST